MSLTFGTAATDRVDISPASSINNLGAFTVATWIKLKSLTAPQIAQFIFGRGTAGNQRKAAAQVSDGSAEVTFSVDRATTSSSFTTNSTLLVINQWLFLCFTYDINGSAGNVGHIYKGTLSSPVAEATYSTSTDGSGALKGDDSALNMKLYNAASDQRGIDGKGGWFGLWNRALSLSELKSIQFHPRVTSGCVGFYRLGDNGTGTQRDFSGNGNNGTVTGATQSDNPPLRRRAAWYQTARYRSSLVRVPWPLLYASGEMAA